MATTGVSDEDILLAQRIIGAAGRHDVEALKVLMKNGGSANVRDDKKTTPLHAAIAAGTIENEDQTVQVVKLLLENGAIWNDTDKNDETPGCIALRLGLKSVYEAMIEAGVRAELLFNAMGDFGLEEIIDIDEDMIEYDEDDDDVEIIDTTIDTEDAQQSTDPTTESTTADDDWYDVSQNNHSYLASQLRYRGDSILLDSSNNAVMMSWETEIMTRHAATILRVPSLRALNVGHGMGIVDTQIQLRQPKEHHIIEAHPQVLARLRETGWFEKPGVRIWEGRWQDVLPRMVAEGVRLDGIYYDTFAEDYAAFKAFVQAGVVPLLADGGIFGWYNGLGADRQICYDIYTRVAEMDLWEMGFETRWEDIQVPEGLHGSKDWEGTKRPYWTIDVYRLPVNTRVKK